MFHKILEKKISAAYKRILLPVLLYTKYDKTNIRPFRSSGRVATFVYIQ